MEELELASWNCLTKVTFMNLLKSQNNLKSWVSLIKCLLPVFIESGTCVFTELQFNVFIKFTCLNCSSFFFFIIYHIVTKESCFKMILIREI